MNGRGGVKGSSILVKVEHLENGPRRGTPQKPNIIRGETRGRYTTAVAVMQFRGENVAINELACSPGRL